jgi:tRNA dimethylallyltransferase
MKKIICLTGTTGAGKTKLSLELALKYQTSVINADSVCLYQELQIGSAKPTKEEQLMVDHRLLSVASIENQVSIYEYQELARAEIEKQELPFFVGGSALYLRAVLYDYVLPPETKKTRITEVEHTRLELKKLILAKNPQFVFPPDCSDRRLARYLEKLENGLDPIPEVKPGYYADYQPLIIYLDLPRPLQAERFKVRLQKMLDDGFLAEIQGLKKPLKIIGYSEFAAYLEGLLTYDEAFAITIKRTLELAKKQKTFFKNNFNVVFVDASAPDVSEQVKLLIDQFLAS